MDGGDNLCLDGVEKILVEHCEFRGGVDGNLDIKNASDLVEVCLCRFRYALPPKSGGSGGSDDHRFSNLIGHSDAAFGDRGRLRTVFRLCVWEGCAGRPPRVRFGRVAIFYAKAGGIEHPVRQRVLRLCGKLHIFKGPQKPWADFTANSAYRVEERGFIFAGCERPEDCGSGEAFKPAEDGAEFPASGLWERLEDAGPARPAGHGAKRGPLH